MRPVNPENQYHIGIHKNGKYWYASTQPRTLNPKTGKITYPWVHWGTVDQNLKFTPGMKFIYASPEERSKLIFPTDWDLSQIDLLLKNENTKSHQENETTTSFSSETVPLTTQLKKPKTDETNLPVPLETQTENRLYGDVWLMEQIISTTGLRSDLMQTFDGNEDMTNDILTLAMYLVMGKGTLNQVVTWQRISKTPSRIDLSASDITRITQNITNQHRIKFFELWKKRLRPSSLCAVDSTSRSPYGNSLADISWEKNKEKIPLPQTLEVVLYSLSDHMPVYYRSFPGNIPDARSLETTLFDWENSGLMNIILVTDRGYNSLKNLNLFIRKNLPVIMGISTNQKNISENLPLYSINQDKPDGMEFYPKERLFFCQKDLEYQIMNDEGNFIKVENLKLNIYFNLYVRSEEIISLQTERYEQEEQLKQNIGMIVDIDDEIQFKKQYFLYSLVINKETRILESFIFNEEKYAHSIKQAGFSANITYNLDMNPIEVLNLYNLRDEQEKYFTQMKSILGYRRVRCWSEQSKIGREFLQFIAQIILCRIKYIRKTKLYDDFKSTEEILNEMRSIRYIEHPNAKPFITPFIGKQIAVCDAFEFKIPNECALDYLPQKNSRKKGNQMNN